MPGIRTQKLVLITLLLVGLAGHSVASGQATPSDREDQARPSACKTCRTGHRRVSLLSLTLNLAAAIPPAVLTFAAQSESPHWEDDEFSREAFGIADYDERNSVATASDVLLGAMVAAPVLGELLVSTRLSNSNYSDTIEFLSLGLSALTTSWLFNETFKHLFRRARPIQFHCATPGVSVTDQDCRQFDREDDDIHSDSTSFYSGHTALAFTGAWFLCFQLTEGHVDGVGGAVMCGLGQAVATTVGTMRMAAHAHYLSDVLVGAGAGFVFGWLYPHVLRAINSELGVTYDDGVVVAVAPTWDPVSGAAFVSADGRF